MKTSLREWFLSSVAIFAVSVVAMGILKIPGAWAWVALLAWLTFAVLLSCRNLDDWWWRYKHKEELQMLDPETDYLQLFDDLPDLRQLAREQHPEALYRFQDELREKYRADGVAFLWSMPCRHYGQCRECDRKFTFVIYQMENSRQNASAATNSTHLHAVREHGAELDGTVKLFLGNLNSTAKPVKVSPRA